MLMMYMCMYICIYIIYMINCICICIYVYICDIYIYIYLFIYMSRLFKSFEFGNGNRMSDEDLVILEFKYLQNK